MSWFKFDLSYFLVKCLLKYLRNMFYIEQQCQITMSDNFYTTHNRGWELFMQDDNSHQTVCKANIIPSWLFLTFQVKVLHFINL